MSRVFIILSILILFVQNIFSADQEINLTKNIYLKDKNWGISDDKLIPIIIEQTSLKDDSKFEIFEVDSSSSEKISLGDIYSLPIDNSSFLPKVGFKLQFVSEPNHGETRFDININPELIGQKIFFNIDGVEFDKLKHLSNGLLWNHLHFNKIKVSSIYEKKIDLVPEKKYALKYKDISKNKIVVVNANDKHLKTLQCLNPKFKIINVENEIKIEKNQINNISKENNNNILNIDSKVYFKDRYFGSISKVEKSTISIKIDENFCSPNEFVCLDDSISFIAWDDIRLKLVDCVYNWQKREICKKFKDYFTNEIEGFFITNGIAPKIKIRKNNAKVGNNISITSLKVGNNELKNVQFEEEIDLSPYDLNNQSIIEVQYKADNVCDDCKKENPTFTTTQEYDIYSLDDVIEISLDQVDASHSSNPKVNINLPEGVEVYFKGDKVTTNTIDVPIHTESIELKFEKEGYEPFSNVYKFDKLHLNGFANVDCTDVLFNMKRKPWPKITIENRGTAEAKIFVEIGTKELNPIEIASNKNSTIDINDIYNDLDQTEIRVSIKCDENEEQKFDISRGGNDIPIRVKGIKKLWVDTLKPEMVKDYRNKLKRHYDLSRSTNTKTASAQKENIEKFVREKKIDESDLESLLEGFMSEEEITKIKEIAFPQQ